MSNTLKFSHIRVKSLWLRALLGANFGFLVSLPFYLQLSCYMKNDYLMGNQTCSYMKVKLVTLFRMPWGIYANSLDATPPRFRHMLCAEAHVHNLRNFICHWKILIFIWVGVLIPTCLNNIFVLLFQGNLTMIFSMIYYLKNFLLVTLDVGHLVWIIGFGA